jgi:broad specificity phosphatase PhoE
MTSASSDICTLYIVRHGETIWNTEHKMQGHHDSPLTENGRAQAQALATVLKDIHIDHVFSSDLGRAATTAEILALDKKLAVTTTKLIRERRFGDYEGKTSIKFVKDLKQLLDQKNTLTVKQQADFDLGHGIETDGQLMGRCFTYLREIAEAYSGQTVLLVSHSGVMITLLMHLGLIETFYGVKKINNAAYIKLTSDGADFFVEELHGIELAEESSRGVTLS